MNGAERDATERASL